MSTAYWTCSEECFGLFKLRVSRHLFYLLFLSDTGCLFHPVSSLFLCQNTPVTVILCLLSVSLSLTPSPFFSSSLLFFLKFHCRLRCEAPRHSCWLRDALRVRDTGGDCPFASVVLSCFLMLLSLSSLISPSFLPVSSPLLFFSSFLPPLLALS